MILENKKARIKFKNSYLSYLLMYQFYYFSWALFAALISVYLLDLGYSATEVSLLLSVSFIFSMIVQPIIGYLSDRFDVKKVNALMLLIGGSGGIAFMISKDLVSLVFFYGLVIAMINGTNPVIEKMATTSRFSYGKIRIWGTIGYATGSQIAGLIYENISPKAIFVFFAISIVLTVIGIWGTEDLKEENLRSELASEDLNKKNNFIEVLKNKEFVIYLVIAGIFFGTVNVANSYIPAMLQEQGLDISIVSFILFLAVICEAPIILFCSTFMDKISNKKLLIIAFSLTITQYFCYSLIPIVAFKILATFLAKHVAAMLFVMINLKVISTIVSPRYQITALALGATISKNLSTVIFQNISGFILDNYNFERMFLVLLVASIIGLIAVLFYKIPSGNDKRLFS